MILKVESTSKYPRRIDVIISTWTRLSMWIELSTMANRRRFVHWVVSWAVLLYTMKPLNSGHLRFLKNLSVIERCPLLGGNMKKIVIFVVKCFVRYSWYVCYLRCPLLRGFTVSSFILLGKAAWDMQWRYREKRNDQEHHEKTSFFHLAEFFLFCFWENAFFNSCVVCYVICSCRKTFKQLFTDVLQNKSF